MELPLGVPDPYFACELAQSLGMSLRQLGESMSAHEMNVIWPEFFAARDRLRQREEEKQQGRPGR